LSPLEPCECTGRIIVLPNIAYLYAYVVVGGRR
jgi:hypothetical protein